MGLSLVDYGREKGRVFCFHKGDETKDSVKGIMKKKNFVFCLALASLALIACGTGNEGGSSNTEPAPGTSTSTTESADSQTSTGSQTSTNSQTSTSTDDKTKVQGYRRVKSIDELQGQTKVMIASDDGGSLVGFTSTNKPNKNGGVYSWYFLSCDLNAVNSNGDVKDIGKAALFDLTKKGDSYTFSVNSKYLSGYVDGTHYSIGLIDAENATTSWSITVGQDGKAQAISASNVYLQFASKFGTWCGYDKKSDVYFYVPSLISVDQSQSSSSTSAPDYGGTNDDSGWEGLDFNTYGNTFRGELKKRISAYKTKTATYTECLSIGAKAASYPQGSNTFVPIYHAAPGTTEGISGNGATTTTVGSCNREHTWPKSRGGNISEKDPFMVRPSLTSENSSRGNNFYGVGSREWDPASCGYEGARGEAARIILYTATAYMGQLELSNNPNDSTANHTMGTLKSLLEWNATYPVSDMEKQINNYLCKSGYGRNPFVDHPEYANYIWDNAGVRTSAFNA